MLYKLVQTCTILSKPLKTYKKYCTIFKIMFITYCIILYNIVGVVQLNSAPAGPPAAAAAGESRSGEDGGGGGGGGGEGGGPAPTARDSDGGARGV